MPLFPDREEDLKRRYGGKLPPYRYWAPRPTRPTWLQANAPQKPIGPLNPVPEKVRMAAALLSVSPDIEVGKDGSLRYKYPVEIPMRQLGYVPTYWEDPRRIAEWRNAIRTAPPGTQLPYWLDKNKINTAYDVLSLQNKGRPWYEWKFPNAEDPLRGYLQGMKEPPKELLSPAEQVKYTPPGQRPEQLEGFVRPGTPEWEELPFFQKAAVSLFAPGELPTEEAIQSAVERTKGTPFELTEDEARQLITATGSGALSMGALGTLSGGFAGGLAGAAAGGVGAVPGALGGAAAGLKFGTATGVFIGGGTAFARTRLQRWAQAQPWFVGPGAPGELFYNFLSGSLDLVSGLLNKGAETVERTLSIPVQTAYSIADPEKYGPVIDLIEHPIITWRSGLSLYEGLPIGEAWQYLPEELGGGATPGKEIWELGKAHPTQLPPELQTGSGWEAWGLALKETRQMLLDNPKLTTLEAVAIASQRFGFGGMMQDFLAQTVLDPLNFAGIEGSLALKKYGEHTGNKYLVEAADRVMAMKKPGLVRTAQAYGNILAATVPKETVAHMDVLSRALAHVTAEGRVSILDEPKGVFGRLMGLTPRARAIEGVALSSDGFKVVLGVRDPSVPPEEVIRRFEAIASTDAKFAQDATLRFFGTPWGDLVVMLARDFNADQLKTLKEMWTVTAPQRDMLNRLASLMGVSPGEFLKQLVSEESGPMFKRVTDRIAALGADPRAREAAELVQGWRLSEKTLKDLLGAFTGDDALPWHPEEWKARLYDAWMSHTAEWMIDKMGVRVEPMVNRLADLNKAVYSLALLDLNPAYAIKNGLSNLSHMIVDGNLEPALIGKELRWLEEFGIEPFRLMQAFGGPAGIGDIASGELRAGVREGTRDALVAAGRLSDVEAIRQLSSTSKGNGAIAQAEKWLHGVRSRVGLASKVSSKMERASSIHATTKGIKEWWSRSWRKGAGYRTMPVELENLLGPDLSTLIYGLVDGSMNQAALEGALLRRTANRPPEAFLADVARDMGIDEQHLRDMLSSVGFLDYYKRRAGEVRTKEDLVRVFAEFDQQKLDYLESLLPSDMEALRGQTEALATVDDWFGVLDEWYSVNRKLADFWTRHTLNMRDMMEEADAIGDLAVRNAFVEAQMTAARSEWKRIESLELAAYQGISDALEKRGWTMPVGWQEHIQARNEARRAFFDTRDELWRLFWRTDFKSGKDRYAKYLSNLEELDVEYRKLTVADLEHQEAMDNAVVDVIARSNAEAADRSAVILEELRQKTAELYAQEGMVRSLTYRLHTQGPPTGKAIAAAVRELLAPMPDLLAKLSGWLSGLEDVRGELSPSQVARRIYRAYVEAVKLPAIADYFNIRNAVVRETFSPDLPVPEPIRAPQDMPVRPVQEPLPEGVPAAPELEPARAVETGTRDLGQLRMAAHSRGRIATATDAGRPFDAHLVNWINGDEGLGLRAQGQSIRRLDQLTPEQTAAAMAKLEERGRYFDELDRVSGETRLSVEALRELDRWDTDKGPGIVKARRLAVANGLEADAADAMTKDDMREWLEARRDGRPYSRVLPLTEKAYTNEVERVVGPEKAQAWMELMRRRARNLGMSLSEFIRTYYARRYGAGGQGFLQSEGTLRAYADVRTNFPEADFWIIRKGTPDKVGSVTKTYSPEHIGVKVTATDVLDPAYLRYAMEYVHQRGYYRDRALGTLQLKHIRVEDVGSIRLGGQSQFQNRQRENRLLAKAVKLFGVTDNPREAGYLLPDGRFLDFSGRHWESGKGDAATFVRDGDRWVPNPRNGRASRIESNEFSARRQADHSEAQQVYDGWKDGGDKWEFMYETGAIRWHYDGEQLIVDLMRAPTVRQLEALEDYGARVRYLNIDAATATNDLPRKEWSYESPEAGSVEEQTDLHMQAWKEMLRRVYPETRGALYQRPDEVVLNPDFMRDFQGSQAVDERGLPKVLYHGTPDPGAVREFDLGKVDPNALFGPAFYFTDDAEIAGGRMSPVARQFLFDTEAEAVAANRVGRVWYDDRLKKWVAQVLDYRMDEAGYAQKPPSKIPLRDRGRFATVLLESRQMEGLTPGEQARVRERVSKFLRSGTFGILLGLEHERLLPTRSLLVSEKLYPAGGVVPAYVVAKRILDMDAVAAEPEWRGLLDRMRTSDVLRPGVEAAETLLGEQPMYATWDDVYSALVQGLIGTTKLTTGQAKERINAALVGAGYDAIVYEGGRRIGTRRHRSWAILKPDAIRSIFNPTQPFGRERGTLYQLPETENLLNKGFYLLSKRLAEVKLKQALPADQLRRFFKNQGVKDEELYWTGLDDWLKNPEQQGRSIRPSEVVEFLDQNPVQLRDVVRPGRVYESTGQASGPLDWAEVDVNEFRPQIEFHDIVVRGAEGQQTRRLARNATKSWTGKDETRGIRWVIHEWPSAKAAGMDVDPPRYPDGLGLTREDILGTGADPDGPVYRVISHDEAGHAALWRTKGWYGSLEEAKALIEEGLEPSWNETYWEHVQEGPGSKRYREITIDFPKQYRRITLDEYIAQKYPELTPEQRQDPKYRTELKGRYDRMMARNPIETPKYPWRRVAPVGGHQFQVDNMIAWVRFGEYWSGGKRYATIDEIQSDWYERGRKEGWLKEDARQLLDAEGRKLGELEREAERTWGEAYKLLWENKEIEGAPDKFQYLMQQLGFAPQWAAWERLLRTVIPAVEAQLPRLRREAAPVQAQLALAPEGEPPASYRPLNNLEIAEWLVRPDTVAKIQAAEDAQLNAMRGQEAYNRLEHTYRNGVMRGPFADNYGELMFKRVLAWAVENGYDGVAWTPGDVQAARWYQAGKASRIVWRRRAPLYGSEAATAAEIPRYDVVLHKPTGRAVRMQGTIYELRQQLGDAVADRIAQNENAGGYWYLTRAGQYVDAEGVVHQAPDVDGEYRRVLKLMWIPPGDTEAQAQEISRWTVLTDPDRERLETQLMVRLGMVPPELSIRDLDEKGRPYNYNPDLQVQGELLSEPGQGIDWGHPEGMRDFYDAKMGSWARKAAGVFGGAVEDRPMQVGWVPEVRIKPRQRGNQTVEWFYEVKDFALDGATIERKTYSFPTREEAEASAREWVQRAIDWRETFHTIEITDKLRDHLDKNGQSLWQAASRPWIEENYTAAERDFTDFLEEAGLIAWSSEELMRAVSGERTGPVVEDSLRGRGREYWRDWIDKRTEVRRLHAMMQLSSELGREPTLSDIVDYWRRERGDAPSVFQIEPPRSRVLGKGSDGMWRILFDGEAVLAFHDEATARRVYESLMMGGAPDPKGLPPKGSATPLGDIQWQIRYFEGADFSTVVHENSHVWFQTLTPEDQQVIRDWVRSEHKLDVDVLDGRFIGSEENATRAAELFARGFEQYLAEGKAPTPKLKALFEQFKAWLLDIYKAIVGSSIDVRINDDVRRVFDRMLATPEELARAKTRKDLQLMDRVEVPEDVGVESSYPWEIVSRVYGYPDTNAKIAQHPIMSARQAWEAFRAQQDPKIHTIANVNWPNRIRDGQMMGGKPIEWHGKKWLIEGTGSGPRGTWPPNHMSVAEVIPYEEWKGPAPVRWTDENGTQGPWVVRFDGEPSQAYVLVNGTDDIGYVQPADWATRKPNEPPPDEPVVVPEWLSSEEAARDWHNRELAEWDKEHRGLNPKYEHNWENIALYEVLGMSPEATDRLAKLARDGGTNQDILAVLQGLRLGKSATTAVPVENDHRFVSVTREGVVFDLGVSSGGKKKTVKGKELAEMMRMIYRIPQKAAEEVRLKTEFTTLSGRTIKAPKQSGQAKNRILQIDAWLHEQALEEYKDTNPYGTAAQRDADYKRGLILGMNPKKLTPAQRTMLNELLFGVEEVRLAEPGAPRDAVKPAPPSGLNEEAERNLARIYHEMSKNDAMDAYDYENDPDWSEKWGARDEELWAELEKALADAGIEHDDDMLTALEAKYYPPDAEQALARLEPTTKPSTKTPGTTEREVAYTGDHWVVREVRKRNGQTAWALARPDGAVVDEFPNRELATRVAQISDERFGGSYAAAERREARRLAEAELVPQVATAVETPPETAKGLLDWVVQAETAIKELIRKRDAGEIADDGDTRKAIDAAEARWEERISHLKPEKVSTIREWTARKDALLLWLERSLAGKPEQLVADVTMWAAEWNKMKRRNWTVTNSEDAILARASAKIRQGSELPGLYGHTTKAHAIDPNTRWEFRYRVMEEADIVVSHDPYSFELNRKYPPELQPRQRDKAAGQKQIADIVQRFNPEEYLRDSARVDDASPIVGPDGVVESGNGRMMSLMRLSTDAPDKRLAYNELLAQRATELGIDPKALSGMQKPVLVRERVTRMDDETRLRFVEECNAPATARMSPSEQAIADGRRLNFDLIATLRTGDGEALDTALYKPVNRDFVRAFMQGIPETERGGYMEADGTLNTAGIERMVAAIFAATFQGDAGKRLVQTLLESPDVNVKRIGTAITGALPELAKMEALIRLGRRPADYTLGEDLAAATEKLAHLRKTGGNVYDYLEQVSMFGEELSPFQKQLLGHLNSKGGVNSIRGELIRYAQAVQRLPDVGQQGLFGETQYPTKQALWEQAGQGAAGPMFQLPEGTTASTPNQVPPVLLNGELTREGYGNVRPYLQALRDRMASADGVFREQELALDRRLSPDQMRMFNLWLQQIKGDMAVNKMAAVRWGEVMRDMSLLNYNQRRGFSGAASFMFPYYFWPTETAVRWMMRMMDMPSLASTYYRLDQLRKKMPRVPGFPSRLQGKLMIPMPFLPDWMGKELWVDPLPQLFPPIMFQNGMEQFTDQRMKDNRAALRILDGWVKDGKASEYEVAEALKTGGELWQRAVDAARFENESGATDVFDFMGTMTGWAPIIDWPRKILTGRPEQISPLPVSRMVKTLTAAAGVGGPGGVNIEAPIRSRIPGMPTWDKFEEYRIDRMLATMTAEGLIDANTALMAQMERKGPAFDEAMRRVEQARLAGGFGNPLYWIGFPGDTFPKGEEIQRALGQEWSKAWDAYNAGDEEALNTFLDRYPEYQVRLASFDKPEERLRSFLVDEIWMRYRALGSTNKDLARRQLGETFQQLFLDKETRAYEAIDLQTLTMWAQALGGTVPQTKETEFDLPVAMRRPTVKVLPTGLASEIDAFKAEREAKHPEWYMLQSMYYQQPPGGARRAFLQRFPQLKRYWDWKRAYYDQHPNVKAYMATAEVSGDEGQLGVLSMPEILTNPLLMEELFGSTFAGIDLSSGALSELQRVWEVNGSPGQSFEAWLQTGRVGLTTP